MSALTPLWATADQWRQMAKQAFEAAVNEGGPFEAWALKIARTHAGSDIWVWDLLPLAAIKAIWRDCCRVTQFEEPFEAPEPAYAELVPRHRPPMWIFMNAPQDRPQRDVRNIDVATSKEGAR